MIKIDKNLIEKIKQNKLYKNAKYLILIKLAVKILFIIIALFWSKDAKSQDAKYYYFSAYANFQNNKNLDALNFIDIAIDTEPNNYIYYLLKGNIFFAESNFEAANNCYLIAEKIKPNTATLNLAYSYSNLSNSDSSIYFLKQYLNKTDKLSYFEIYYDEKFKNISNTKNWNLLWEKNWYSDIYTELNDAKYDFKYAKKIEALEKVNLIIKKQNKFADAYFFKAQILVDAKNYQEAIKYFSKAIELKPNNSEFYFQRALAYSEIKKNKNSISDFNKCLELNPYNLDVYLFRAKVFNSEKKYELAKNDIIYYNVFYPNNVETKFLEANIFFNCSEYLECIKI